MASASPLERPPLPAMPEGLSGAAQDVWRRQLAAVESSGLLPVDADALRVYVEAVVRYEQAARLLESSGPLIKGSRDGELVKSPLHQVVKDNAAIIRQYARELGFVPAVRGGVTIVNSDPLEAWLRGDA